MVAGGGPIGLAAAIALARLGNEVHLVAPLTPPLDDRRTVALLAASWGLLEELGWTREAHRHRSTCSNADCRCDRQSVPNAAGDIQGGEVGLEAFGWNIPLVSLISQLEALAAAQPRMTRHAAMVTGARTVTATASK